MANSPKAQYIEDDRLATNDTLSTNSDSDIDGRTLSGMSTPRDEKAASPPPEQAEEDDPKQIITLPLSDPEHPNNWSQAKKYFILVAGVMTVVHSTLGSSLPSNAVPFIAASFGVTDELQMVLPISTFLIVSDWSTPGLCQTTSL